MASSLGEGSLILTTNSTGLVTGLKQANAKLSEFSAKAKEMTASVGGSLGNFLELGGKAGIAGVLAVGAIELAKNMGGLVTRSQMFHNELERGGKLAAAWSEVVGKGIERSRKELEAMADILGTSQGIEAQKRQLKTLDDQLASTAPQLKKAREEVERWQSVWGKDTSVMQAFLIGSKEDFALKAQKKLDEIETVYKQRFERAQELRKGLLEIADPTQSIEATNALRKFIVEMDDAVKGLTENSDIMKLEKLKDAFGFSNADIGAARLAAINKEMAIANDELDRFVSSQYSSDVNADVQKLTELAEQHKLTAEQIQKGQDAIFAKNDREAQRFARSLEEDLGLIKGFYKKSSEEIQLQDLIEKGIDEKHIARIKQLIAYKKELDTPYQPSKAIQAGSADAFSLQNKIKFEEDRRFGMNQEKLLKEMAQKLQQIVIGLGALDRSAPEI
ncbi:hypothetical protein J8F10_19435 [Gemmata sp. G18]|uniref:Bacteriophage tail tape measure N-terminal domain-containing protein n=1 Tax=Gemmata palustris TaxID=2822762 RepID=A0ABS5BW12_9BACT|nr:hypothetical protein [Gemmata palustris]MBP3957425.1 hypothetical protein [Gemmata palustris]